MSGHRATLARRLFFGAALGLSFVAACLAAPARADAVGMLDPELAQICGGSAHSPRCRTEHVGMACCGGTVVVLGVAGAVLALGGRREKS